MPKGVYKKSPEHIAKLKKYLKLGHTPEAREKARKKMIQKAKDPEWIKKVSEGTRKAMHDPKIRQKHLKALAKNLQKYGVGYKGGNGQPKTEIVKQFCSLLEPQGFICEHPVKTAGHGTGLNTPTVYKTDFGHPIKKIAIELDGPSHRSLKARARDEKKDTVLRSLGWEVIRIKHA